MSVRSLVILWTIWGAFSLLALAFIALRPAMWASIVDRENDFWVRRGWFSAGFAGRMKSLEKGVIPKLFLAAMALISVSVICVLLRAQKQHPFKAMRPPVAPVQRQRPLR